MSAPEVQAKEHRVRAAPVDGIVRERRWYFFLLPTAWVAAAFWLTSWIVVEAIFGLRQAGVNFAAIDQNVFTTVAAAVIYVLLLAFTLGLPRLFKLWSGRFDYRRLLGFTRLMQWRDILFAALGFVVYLALGIGLVLIVSKCIPGFNPTQVQDTGFGKYLTPHNAILVFISLVVIAPVAEETIFRGYLFGTLRRILPVWVAALVTSALFGLVHGQWNVGLDVFVMSLVSCFLRYRTGSLWASILLHMAKNGLAFYTLYVATGSIG